MTVWKNLQSIVAVSLALLPLATAVHAQTPSPLSGQIEADQHALEGTEQEITSIAERVKAVEQLLATAQQKQDETAKGVARLKAEAEGLVPRITAQTAAYQRKLETLKSAVLMDYQAGQADAFRLMVESGTVSETLAKSSYLSSIQDRMDKLAREADEAHEQLLDRKSDLDSKRSTQEVLGRQLTILQQSIVHQKQELAELQAGKSDEASYLAERIAKAKAAEEAILLGATDGALWGTYGDGARVRQGEIIGLEGSTGFSTGCHTHFSVIQGSKWLNPQPFLDTKVLRHPDGRTTQPFGMTDYARSGAYGGGVHNGIDLVQGCGAPVRAAADGVVIRDNRTDGSGFGHYIMIRHDNGLVTLYGHLI